MCAFFAYGGQSPGVVVLGLFNTQKFHQRKWLQRWISFSVDCMLEGEPLYAGSPSSFRRRWDAILAALGVPKTIGLTPASMRAGGAITAYRTDEDIMKILWRMRLKSLQTFSHYLQEVGALSVFGELPFDCRLRIERAAELYSFLLPGPSFLAAPSST